MKPKTILTILLISTLFVSCSKDEDNDPKYNWELKIHHKIYDRNGDPQILDASGRADWIETVIVENKSEKQINDHLVKEYKNKLCHYCYPNNKPWPYPVWKDPNSNFYYYKEEIPDFQGPNGPISDHGRIKPPIYHERTGTLTKLD
jgi:hypothetical protein